MLSSTSRQISRGYLWRHRTFFRNNPYHNKNYPLSSSTSVDHKNHYCESLSFSTVAHQAQSLLSDEALKHQSCNIPPSIRSKVGENLHLRDKHPLNTIKKSIEDYFQGNDPSLQTFDNLCPIVPVKNNFDLLRIPPDHVSRSKSDTYYLNDEQVLRTHTSAHQVDLLTKGINSFLVSGDAYRYVYMKNNMSLSHWTVFNLNLTCIPPHFFSRRDEIDSSHYPVFHQMEGVKLFSVQQDLVEKENLKTKADQMKYVELHLKQSLEGLVRHLFGDVVSTYSNFLLYIINFIMY